MHLLSTICLPANLRINIFPIGHKTHRGTDRNRLLQFKSVVQQPLIIRPYATHGGTVRDRENNIAGFRSAANKPLCGATPGNNNSVRPGNFVRREPEESRRSLLACARSSRGHATHLSRSSSGCRSTMSASAVYTRDRSFAAKYVRTRKTHHRRRVAALTTSLRVTDDVTGQIYDKQI